MQLLGRKSGALNGHVSSLTGRGGEVIDVGDCLATRSSGSANTKTLSSERHAVLTVFNTSTYRPLDEISMKSLSVA